MSRTERLRAGAHDGQILLSTGGAAVSGMEAAERNAGDPEDDLDH